MPSLYPSFTPTYHHDQYPTIDPTQASLDCSGKIVLITGGGRGIGKALAQGFAKAKCKGIILLGRDGKTLQESAEQIKTISPFTDVFITVADIQRQEQVQSAFEAAVSHFNNTALTL